MPVDPPVSDLPPARLRFTDGISRRAVGIAATIAIELVILLILLSLGVRTGPAAPAGGQVTTFDAREAAEAEEAEAESAEEAEQPDTPTPRPETPVVVSPALPPTALPRESANPLPPAPVAPPPAEPQPAPETPPQPPRARAVIRPGANIGPADTGSRNGPDSQIVGTAPDGSPLYAARWYTEPTDQQLRGFMSGARGPGWGLIACKTAPNWRVEDCVVLGESPVGSNIANSFNAASWQFLVRPARVDGEYLVGSWVRIRLDYTNPR